MTLTIDERTELDELRSKVLRMEQTKKDNQNPNVLLIEGQITPYEGEYSCFTVKTGAGIVYLTEVLENLMGWRGRIGTFCWHMATEPLSFYELEEALVRKVMGGVTTEFRHAYSDLTGYLWTTEKIEAGGHDVLKELNDTYARLRGDDYDNKVYLAFRVEKLDED